MTTHHRCLDLHPVDPTAKAIIIDAKRFQRHMSIEDIKFELQHA